MKHLLSKLVLVISISSPFLAQANSVPFADTGDLFVLDRNAGVLKVTSTGDISLEVSIAQIEAVSGENSSLSNGGIAFDNHNNMYFVDNDVVMKYSKSGVLSVLASETSISAVQGLASGNSDAEGLSIAADGNIYITDDRNESILKINANSGNISVLATKADILAATGFDSIDIQEGLVTGADGYIYVSSEDRGDDSSTTVREQDAIIRISPDGSIINILMSNDTIADPDQFMTLDSDGNLIVASDEGDTEQIFKVDILDGSVTQLISTFDLESLLSDLPPDIDVRGGLAYDALGNLFIGDSDEDLILKFDANGIGSVFITEADIIAITGQVSASLGAGFAFAPGAFSIVPEPKIWWMLLISFLGLAFYKNKQLALSTNLITTHLKSSL